MAKKKKGYSPIWRDVQDHWLWKSDEPFDCRSAWIDLILSVNHEEKKIKVDGQIITIHAGQMWTSYKKLANRWNWSRERVYRYTKMLKSDGMIYMDATPRGTLLTLMNYDNFQLHGNTHETSNETSNEATIEAANEATHETQTITNKNDKKHKKNEEKKERFPSLDEIEPPVGGGQWQ